MQFNILYEITLEGDVVSIIYDSKNSLEEDVEEGAQLWQLSRHTN
jgi:hypothetical protein